MLSFNKDWLKTLLMGLFYGLMFSHMSTCFVEKPELESKSELRKELPLETLEDKAARSGDRNFDFRNNNYNQNQDPPSFCGPLIGQHYMVGSYNYCGGFSVNNCSALCFIRNFTYFQCEGQICHCFS